MVSWSDGIGGGMVLWSDGPLNLRGIVELKVSQC
jgi:hypothetical protein